LIRYHGNNSDLKGPLTFYHHDLKKYTLPVRKPVIIELFTVDRMLTNKIRISIHLSLITLKELLR